MNIYLLTATCGRHTLLERSVGMFWAQDYPGEATQIIFNNSDVPLRFDDSAPWPKNRTIILINSCNKGYKNLGEIYNDLLGYLPEDGIVAHFDDDDCILPNHISEGIKGLERAKSKGYEAYKPKFSYFYSGGKVSKVSNVMEPSIFLPIEILKSNGYHNTTSDQHLKWVNFLTDTNRLYTDPEGVPTLLYEWGNEVPTFKTSGNPTNPENFKNYRDFSQDHGDGIISPWSKEKIDNLYKELYKQINNG